MKTSRIILLLSTLTFTNVSLAGDLLNSAKNLLADSSAANSGLNVTGMVGAVAESLGITQSQATGSLGSIFEYAKNNITEEQVSSLSNSLPGLDSLLSAAPSLSGSSSADNANSLGGLLGKAAEYSDSLSAIAGLQQQFESLGLDTDMISQVIQSAYRYLDTEQGKQVKALLQQGLASLKL